MKLSATSASCVPNLWHAIPVGVETETEAGNEYGSVCRCAGVGVWGCVCGQVCKSKSCGQLCCHATLMSRRMRPQNLTAKGFKLKKFNEHAYLIKARTHTYIWRVCGRETGGGSTRKAAHSFGHLCRGFSCCTTFGSAFQQGMQSSKLSRSEFIDKPALDTCDTTCLHLLPLHGTPAVQQLQLTLSLQRQQVMPSEMLSKIVFHLPFAFDQYAIFFYRLLWWLGKCRETKNRERKRENERKRDRESGRDSSTTFWQFN